MFDGEFDSIKLTMAIVLIIVIGIIAREFLIENNVKETPTIYAIKETPEELGYFKIPLTSGITLDSKSGQVDFTITNAVDNLYSFNVLILDPSGSTIYESGIIQPGYTLDHIIVDTDLKKGVYKNYALVYKCYELYSDDRSGTRIEFPITVYCK